jgi:hypothetical protein
MYFAQVRCRKNGQCGEKDRVLGLVELDTALELTHK